MSLYISPNGSELDTYITNEKLNMFTNQKSNLYEKCTTRILLYTIKVIYKLYYF